ncbi:2Fe-2S iron-sulfur cluster-binding protein [uncultured Ferrimonas sp.]|uniref:2Fe-2S iron-sulfur cluster-binding protein n=1 Tax=uncultured Ferrimonas sp. TaxID=432640 RepID=UPI00262F06FC|nr:2Fe-2S iron-sulfur cluster-binding protein [uncultured Ferrimonas sp.]
MANITFEQQDYPNVQGETVLDTLLQQRIELPYGCRSGVCQACLMQCTQGQPGRTAQQGLSSQQQAQGYFLPCSCVPTTDLTVQRPPLACRYHSKILATDQLTANVLRLRFSSPIPFQPGQSLQLNINNVQRRYSIASVPPQQAYIEVHIECRPSGQFSHLAQQLQVGDPILLSSAHGDCTYNAVSAQQPLLLIGHNTGLAPLYGLAQQALQHGHQADINLIHACQPQQFYLESELRTLAQQYPQFHLHQLPLFDNPTAEIATYLKLNWPQLQLQRLWLAGSEPLLNAVAKSAFIQGAKRQQIHIEAFSSTH